MNHTPGPWTIERKKQTIEIIGAREDHPVGAGNGRVCNTGFHAVHNAKGSQPSERLLANARLIAAAPDLLADLQWLLDYAPTPADAARVRATIAKATGGVV